MTITNWSQLLDAFPIKEQAKIDDAAAFLQQERATGLAQRRANAWLAYTAITAAIDRWDTAQPGWGHLRGKNGLLLRGEALALSDEAIRGLPPGFGFTYDIWWADGFVALHKGLHDRARASWKSAADTNLPLIRHLFAEAADAYVLVGQLTAPPIRNAEAMINRALGGYSGTPPAWFYWVKAWVLVAQAAQFPQGGQDRRDLAILANDFYDRMPKEATTGLPFDFDAAVIHMLANFCINGTRDLATWNQLNAVVDQRKPHLRNGGKAACWSYADELAREPFLTGVPEADAVARLLRDALPDCA
jgi:hypothetical protein